MHAHQNISSQLEEERPYAHAVRADALLAQHINHPCRYRNPTQRPMLSLLFHFARSYAVKQQSSLSLLRNITSKNMQSRLVSATCQSVPRAAAGHQPSTSGSFHRLCRATLPSSATCLRGSHSPHLQSAKGSVRHRRRHAQIVKSVLDVTEENFEAEVLQVRYFWKSIHWHGCKGHP